MRIVIKDKINGGIAGGIGINVGWDGKDIKYKSKEDAQEKCDVLNECVNFDRYFVDELI
jgi:hypothetical protein